MVHDTFNYQKIEPWANGYIDPDECNNFHSRHFRCLLSELEGINGKVLEIGCGAGRAIRSLKRFRPEVEVYGCDISLPALKKAVIYPENGNYQQADACQLPYRDVTFVAIVVWDVIEHLDQPELAIKEMHRILKPGGLVSAVVPCEGNTYTIHNLVKKTSLGKLRYKLHGHIQRLKICELKTMFLRAGFKLKNIRYDLHWLGQMGDLLGDILLERGFSRSQLWGKKSMKFLLHPTIGLYAILWKLACYESILFNSFPTTALSIELTLEKKGKGKENEDF